MSEEMGNRSKTGTSRLDGFEEKKINVRAFVYFLNDFTDAREAKDPSLLTGNGKGRVVGREGGQLLQNIVQVAHGKLTNCRIQ